MELDFEVNAVSEKRAVLAAKGDLNAITAPALRARIEELVKRGQVELVCDLSAVDSLDSSGLSALVYGLKAARQGGGWLKLRGLKEQANTLLNRTALDSVFEISTDGEIHSAAGVS